MTFFLADTENIADRWYDAALNAEPGDVFLLFYSDNSNKRMDFDIFAQASLQGASFRFIKCYNKRENALDFQLTAYLGILYASHPDDRFIVMSRDEGFDSAILFLRDLGADVRRFPPPVQPVIPAPVLSRTYAEATRPMVSAVTIPADESLLDETPVEQAADIGPLPAPPGADGAGQDPVSQDEDFPAAQDDVPRGIPDTVDGLLPGDIVDAPAVQPVRKSEVQQFIDTLSCYNQGVAGYYQTSLLRLGVTDEHDLAEAVAILYGAMKDPPNTRRAAAYSAFRRRYGIRDGQVRYRPIKDFVGKIAANGPVPKQDTESVQDQLSIPADSEVQEPVRDGEDDLREGASAMRKPGSAPPQQPVPTTQRQQLILDLPELCPDLTGDAYAAIADAMLLSSMDKGTYSTYSGQLKSIFGQSAGQSLYKKTKTMFASLLLEKSSAALEKNISSACPELTKEQIAKVRSAMTEAKRISPKNHTAGYGMTLKDIFPDPAVKKMVFTKTRGLLAQA